MKTKIQTLALAVLLATGADASAQEPPPQAEQTPSETTEASQRAEMRREVDEAARAISAYSVARRADAAKRAQQAMDDMDRRLRYFQAEWSAEAKRIGERSQANRERALVEARGRRAELDKQYHAMQDSNAQAWARARESFIRAYRDLAATLGIQRAKPEPKKKDKADDDEAKKADEFEAR